MTTLPGLDNIESQVRYLDSITTINEITQEPLKKWFHNAPGAFIKAMYTSWLKKLKGRNASILAEICLDKGHRVTSLRQKLNGHRGLQKEDVKAILEAMLSCWTNNNASIPLKECRFTNIESMSQHLTSLLFEVSPHAIKALNFDGMTVKEFHQKIPETQGGITIVSNQDSNRINHYGPYGHKQFLDIMKPYLAIDREHQKGIHAWMLTANGINAKASSEDPSMKRLDNILGILNGFQALAFSSGNPAQPSLVMPDEDDIDLSETIKHVMNHRFCIGLHQSNPTWKSVIQNQFLEQDGNEPTDSRYQKLATTIDEFPIDHFILKNPLNTLPGFDFGPLSTGDLDSDDVYLSQSITIVPNLEDYDVRRFCTGIPNTHMLSGRGSDKPLPRDLVTIELPLIDEEQKFCFMLLNHAISHRMGRDPTVYSDIDNQIPRSWCVWFLRRKGIEFFTASMFLKHIVDFYFIE